MQDNMLKIKSSKNDYTVHFQDSDELNFETEVFLLVDKNIEKLHKEKLKHYLELSRHVIYIDCTEDAKNIENVIQYIYELTESGINRQSSLVCIGGGIIQDITCFISLILFRGISWTFIPTTLLAQADSCIGSKSSINTKLAKNLLGGFWSPETVIIDQVFLKTLNERDIRSGMAEIIKVHLIDGLESFEGLTITLNEFKYTNLDGIEKLIQDSLFIKKRYIEIDEFDQNERLIFNYGHTFGHALEKSTFFQIPHGLAVNIGMHLANFYALSLGFIDDAIYEKTKRIFISNYKNIDTHIDVDLFFQSIYKDKKNTNSEICLILPINKLHKLDRFYFKKGEDFKKLFLDFCKQYFDTNTYNISYDA